MLALLMITVLIVVAYLFPHFITPMSKLLELMSGNAFQLTFWAVVCKTPRSDLLCLGTLVRNYCKTHWLPVHYCIVYWQMYSWEFLRSTSMFLLNYENFWYNSGKNLTKLPSDAANNRKVTMVVVGIAETTVIIWSTSMANWLTDRWNRFRNVPELLKYNEKFDLHNCTQIVVAFVQEFVHSCFLELGLSSQSPCRDFVLRPNFRLAIPRPCFAYGQSKLYHSNDNNSDGGGRDECKHDKNQWLFHRHEPNFTPVQLPSERYLKRFIFWFHPNKHAEFAVFRTRMQSWWVVLRNAIDRESLCTQTLSTKKSISCVVRIHDNLAVAFVFPFHQVDFSTLESKVLCSI